jgi:hypothetical protein
MESYSEGAGSSSVTNLRPKRTMGAEGSRKWEDWFSRGKALRQENGEIDGQNWVSPSASMVGTAHLHPRVLARR